MIFFNINSKENYDPVASNLKKFRVITNMNGVCTVELQYGL